MGKHKPMPREERAKQFVAFSALKGYSDALRKKEEEVLRSYTDMENGKKKENSDISYSQAGQNR